ncbi:MAG TPA: hypothetical protein VH061_03560 [Solirubrobacteraceae bacterium]|jgi:hypothetical protein|nr:hypothetical protein [Solirubrobacteraceae bacterium]
MSTLTARRGLLTLAVASALLVGSFAVAASASASTLYACVKKSGSAHVFAKKPKCKKGETKLSWSATGPAGKNGANGSNGANGTNGKDGAPGQPQKAVSFNVSSNFGPSPIATPLFSIGGASVRLNCASLAEVPIPEIEVSAPAGGFSEIGAVITNTSGKAPEVEQSPLVFDVPLSSAFGIVMKMTGNVKPPLANIAHIDGSLTTPAGVVFIDAFVEANEKGSTACTAKGSAFALSV